MVLAKGSVLKAVAMIVFGLLLAMVGSDIEAGASRFTFDIPELYDGFDFATSRWACSASPRSSAISKQTTKSTASWSSRRSPA